MGGGSLHLKLVDESSLCKAESSQCEWHEMCLSLAMWDRCPMGEPNMGEPNMRTFRGEGGVTDCVTAVTDMCFCFLEGGARPLRSGGGGPSFREINLASPWRIQSRSKNPFIPYQY